jgi:hypothetical protein
MDIKSRKSQWSDTIRGKERAKVIHIAGDELDFVEESYGKYSARAMALTMGCPRERIYRIIEKLKEAERI